MKYFIMLVAVFQVFCEKIREDGFTMYPMLINLFNGNIDFAKRTLPDFPLQKHHQKEYDKLKKQLDGLLNEDGQELLEELLETSSSEGRYSDYDSFISGFRFAALLMMEVFHDKESMLENKEQYLRHFIHRPYRGTPSPLDDCKD